MPLFEYRCADCATDVEILVRGGEQPACPDCGSRKLEKLFSATAAPVMAGASLPWREVVRPRDGAMQPALLPVAPRGLMSNLVARPVPSADDAVRAVSPSSARHARSRPRSWMRSNSMRVGGDSSVFRVVTFKGAD